MKRSPVARVIAIAFLPGLAWAQSSQAQNPTPSTPATSQSATRNAAADASAAGANARALRDVRASKLIGMQVRNPQGENLGEIQDVIVDVQDLVINMGSGRVRYAVVDFDKAWSPDDKMLALPLSAFRFGQGRTEAARLNVPRERLDMSRGFDANQWPDLNDARYRADIDRYLASVAAPASERGRSGGAAAR